MIKACNKVRVDSWDRYFRIRRILYKWKIPDFQVLWICSWRFKLESNHVPKFLATARSNVNASYGKAINIYFGKLLFCTNQHELSFVIIKFELIRKHPRTNVRYTAFHGNDRISLISSRVRTKRQVKLSVISIGMCFR